MGESLITMAIVGLITGFIFSMPIAGPVSILVTSNALKGRIFYCNRVVVGASIADFIYVFLAVFGITKFYPFLKPAMPYILFVGGLFILFIAYKVFKSKLDFDHLDDKGPKPAKAIKQHRGGFYTGFMVNLLNPSLIFGWLTTSVLVISFISSLGFDTGGLDIMVDQNFKTLSIADSSVVEHSALSPHIKADTLKFLRNHAVQAPTERPEWFPETISLVYALAVAVGSIAWYLILTVVIARFRRWINLRVVNGIIHGLGIILFCFGIFFGYSAIKMLF